MFDTIPPTPSAVVDVPLDPAGALALAGQALAAERPLATTFKMSKVVGEVTGQQPNAVSYRTYVRSFVGRFRMNDGYITATPTGPNATRLQIHENKRYVTIMGIVTAVGIAVVLIAYFLLAPSKSRWNMDWLHRSSSFDWTIFLWVGVGGAVLSAAAQTFEMVGMPAKLAAQIGQGPAGLATPQFGGQPGFGHAPQHAQPFGAPQGGFAPPPQPAFAPPPPPPQGFGMLPQGFAPPPPPGGFPAPPQAAAPAGVPAVEAAPPPPAAAASPLADPAVVAQLEELGKLRDGGIITEADYDQARAAILAKRS